MKTSKKQLTTMVYKDYTITPCDCAKERFDLFKEAMNKKTNKPYLKAIGYGYSFVGVIEQIIHEELSERKDITSLQGYITEYKKSSAEVRGILAN